MIKIKRDGQVLAKVELIKDYQKSEIGDEYWFVLQEAKLVGVLSKWQVDINKVEWNFKPVTPKPNSSFSDYRGKTRKSTLLQAYDDGLLKKFVYRTILIDKWSRGNTTHWDIIGYDEKRRIDKVTGDSNYYIVINGQYVGEAKTLSRAKYLVRVWQKGQ